jgi:hypothetical protein
METEECCQALVSVYQTTRNHISEDRNLHIHRRDYTDLAYYEKVSSDETCCKWNVWMCEAVNYHIEMEVRPPTAFVLWSKNIYAMKLDTTHAYNFVK